MSINSIPRAQFCKALRLNWRTFEGHLRRAGYRTTPTDLPLPWAAKALGLTMPRLRDLLDGVASGDKLLPFREARDLLDVGTQAFRTAEAAGRISPALRLPSGQDRFGHARYWRTDVLALRTRNERMRRVVDDLRRAAA